MKNSHSESYAAAGVDVTAGYESVERIKPMVESTYIPGVLGTLDPATGEVVNGTPLTILAFETVLGQAGGVMPTVEEIIEAAKNALKEVK